MTTILGYEIPAIGLDGPEFAQQVNDIFGRLGLVLPLVPEAYGAVGNGITDDSAALQSWLNALAATGGTGRLGRGKTYAYGSQLAANTHSNVTIEGDGGGSSLATSVDASRFLYTGGTGGRTVTDAAITTGTATLTSATAAFTSADRGAQVVINGAGFAGLNSTKMTTSIVEVVNSTTVTLLATAGTTVSGATCSISDKPSMLFSKVAGWTFRKVNFEYSNALFNGDLVQTARLTASGTVSSDIEFDNCRMQGTATAKVAANLYNGTDSLSVRVRNGCLFAYADVGIRGVGDYWDIDDAKFGYGSAKLNRAPIMNLRQSCKVNNPVAIGLANNDAALLDCDDDAWSGTRDVTIDTPWCGDNTSGNGCWVRTRCKKLRILNGMLPNAVTEAIQLVGGTGASNGLVVDSVLLQGVIDFANGTIFGNVTLLGNDMSNASATLTNASRVGTRLTASGNNGFADIRPLPTKAGVPSDADFPHVDAVPNGTEMLDTTNHRLYVRDGGAWKYAALT